MRTQKATIVITSQLIIEGWDDPKLLNEDIAELASAYAADALQFLIAGAAEYGIATMTAPAGGVPGPIAETVIDSLFAAKSIQKAVDAAVAAAKGADEFSDLMNAALGMHTYIAAAEFKKFYESVKKVLTKLTAMAGAESSADELAKSLKEKTASMVKSVMDAVVKGIKVLIPDAATGAAVGAAIRAVVEAISEQPYTAVVAALKQAGDWAKYLIDPSKSAELIGQMFAAVAKFASAAGKKLKDVATWKLVLAGGAGGMAVKKFGPAGLESLSTMINDAKPVIMALVKTITGVIIPQLFTLLAIIQILENGEYKVAKKEVESNATQANEGLRLRKKIRNIIKEQERRNGIKRLKSLDTTW